MNPVSSSTPFLFQGPATAQAPEQRQWQHAERTGRARENHHHHDRHRAQQIFRQEFIRAFRIQFQSELRISAGSTQAYRDTGSDTGSADDVANEIVAGARGAVQQGESAPTQTLARLRQTVTEVASVSRQAVSTEAGQQSVDTLESQVNQGLDTIAADQEFLSASALSVNARSRQRSTISIRTQEGDIVRLDLRRVDRLSVTDVAAQSDTAAASVTEVSVSSRSRLILKVNGDLNDAELEAIRNVFSQAEDLANQFFAGDINAALEATAGLQYDSDQLARVSLRFRSSQQIQVSQATAGNGGAVPGTAAPSAPSATVPPATPPATDTPVEPTVPAATTPANADPVDAATSVAEQQPASVSDTAPPATGPQFGSLVSGFGSLANYIGMISDYLQATADRFNEFLQGTSDNTPIRIRLTESFRLDVLRVVLEERAAAAPAEPASVQPDSVQPASTDPALI